MKPDRLAVSLLVAVLVLAGCEVGAGTAGTGADTGETDTSPTSTAGTPTAASGADAVADERTVAVEHAMGTAEVACTPQRVVTLGQGQTDTVLALGVTPVGVVEPWVDEFYDYLPEEVAQAEVVGSELEPDLEAIAALEPDVILGSELRHGEVHDQLSQIAPTVVSETIGRTWKDNVALWAKALCRPDEGARVRDAWEQRTADFQQELGELADTEVSMVRFMPDQVRIYRTGFPGSVLRDAGLARPEAQQVADWETADQLVEISQERIPEMDGDVIFVMVSDWRGDDAVELEDEWTSHPLWAELEAVQRDAVFAVDEEHWNLGGGILAANAMLDDLEEHFLEPGGARAALTGEGDDR